jgi:hypothetical protein
MALYGLEGGVAYGVGSVLTKDDQNAKTLLGDNLDLLKSTKVTDTKGLIAEAVKIPVEGGEIPAYAAQPEKGENFPIVLVIQEIFGVHEHIQDVVRRFAKLGYLAMPAAG